MVLDLVFPAQDQLASQKIHSSDFQLRLLVALLVQHLLASQKIHSQMCLDLHFHQEHSSESKSANMSAST